MAMTKIEFPSGPSGGNVMQVHSGGTVAIETGGKITGTRIERKAITITTAIATATAATAVLARVASFAFGVTIKKVTLVPSANVAGHATNNSTVALRNVGTTATGTVAVATLTLTTGNACTANVGKDITLTATNATITAGQGLVIHRTKNSSGNAVPASTWVIEYAVAPT